MNFHRAVVLAALFAAGAPPAAQADPLAIFQPTVVRAVSVTSADAKAFAALPPLDAFGTVSGSRTPVVVDVGSAQLASAEAGFPLRLPANVADPLQGKVRYQVTKPVRTSFTFSATKAAAWARAHDVALAPLPAGLDGTTYTVTIEPLALVTYGAAPARAQRAHGVRRASFLTVVQAPVPTIASNGAPLQALSGWFSAQPGIPAHLAAQVRAIGDPTQTLPIPVRFDRQTASDVTVDGVRGLAIGDETGIGSAIVWIKGSTLFAVGGTLTQSGALAVANDLK
jgi:hypothetical protein